MNIHFTRSSRYVSLACSIAFGQLLFFGMSLTAVAQNEKSSDSNTVEAKRPNILWLVQEDLSPWLGCYGHEVQNGATPTIDAMAARGTRFSRAYVPAPVCSACRSAIIVGANQIRFGAHQHRSRRGEASLPLPEGTKTVPGLLKEAGYFCFNVGKTDYNFEHEGMYSEIPERFSSTPWKSCSDGQPFFGQIQLKGGKHNTRKFKNKIDRASVTIPADYPQDEMHREIVAEHYDSARKDDQIIGDILKRLEDDGLKDSTIVVYFSDHGANNLVRHKQQPTEGGSHVPFIITGPDPWVPAPSVRDDLVTMLDLSATTLAWAGIEQPASFEGQNLFGFAVRPREFVATARDRCDTTIERIRSIRTDRYRYTRNYLLDRVLLQPQYRDPKDYVLALRSAYADGTLDPKLAEIYFGERPAEELYDVVNDPAQMNNLVADAKYQRELERHRQLLDGWLAKGDLGAKPEPDIELTMNNQGKWGRAVNSEFERVRTDSDGDGLSDDFEKANGRDPADGKLLFTFDCGGWQTEGWVGKGIDSNIAGRQGFLDFKLDDGSGSLVRTGLRHEAMKQNGIFRIRLRCNKPIDVEVLFGETSIGTVRCEESDQFKEIGFFSPAKRGTIFESIRINLKSQPQARVELDWIKMKK